MSQQSMNDGEQNNNAPADSYVERIHDLISRKFAGYGAYVFRHQSSTVILGFLLALVLSFGMAVTKRETNFDKLWIKTGTRLQDDLSFFESNFGGVPRKMDAILRTTNSEPVTVPQLNYLRSVLVPMITQSENSSNTAQVFLNSKIGLSPTSQGKDYFQKDFCESSAVATAFQPDNTIARGLRYVTQCMGLPTLPISWYVDRFPCRRYTALDCFREGSFDYPAALNRLDNYTVSFRSNWTGLLTCLGVTESSNNQIVALSPNSGYINILVNSGLGLLDATASVQQIYRTTHAATYEWGYQWRQSYTAMSQQQLNTYLSDAIRNTRNSSISARQCVSQGLPCCLTWDGAKIDDQLILGDLITNTNGITAVRALRTSIVNYHHNHPVWADSIGLVSETDRLNLALAWDDKFLDTWSRSAASPAANTQFVYSVTKSMDQTQRDGGEPQAALIVGAYIIVAVYSAISFVRFPGVTNLKQCGYTNWVYSRAVLGIISVVVVAMSTTAAFGFTALVGIKFSPITVNLVPFISLAIGTDNSFFLMNTMNSFHDQPSVLNRMKLTLAVAGPSVLLTGLCNAVAFFIACIFPVEAVQNFVLQMGITICINTIILFVCFVPCMAWDAMRTNEKALDGCFCAVRPEVPDERDASVSEGMHMRYFIEHFYGPVLASVWTKMFVLIVFALFFAAMAVIGFGYTSTGLPLSTLARRDSYIRDYLVNQEKNFNAYDNYVVTKNGNYSSNQFQDHILQAQNNLQTSKWVSSSSDIRSFAWNTDAFTSFYSYVKTQTNSSFVTLDSTTFNTYFGKWARDIGCLHINNIYCRTRAAPFARIDCASFDSISHEIYATRLVYINRDLNTDSDIIDAIIQNRDVTESSSSNSAYPIGYMYKYWQQYIDIRRDMYAAVGWTLLAIFLLCLLLQFNVWLSLLMVAMALMIVIELYGFMSLISCKLNAYSLVNLVIAVGMSLEYTAHVAHFFMKIHGHRDYRMVETLKVTFGPTLHGTLTNLLAVVLLSVAQFPYFSIYYFGMFFAMVIISFINTVVLLPVLLSIMGPRALHYVPGEESQAHLSMKRINSVQ